MCKSGKLTFTDVFNEVKTTALFLHMLTLWDWDMLHIFISLFLFRSFFFNLYVTSVFVGKKKKKNTSLILKIRTGTRRVVRARWPAGGHALTGVTSPAGILWLRSARDGPHGSGRGIGWVLVRRVRDSAVRTCRWSPGRSSAGLPPPGSDCGRCCAAAGPGLETKQRTEGRTGTS